MKARGNARKWLAAALAIGLCATGMSGALAATEYTPSVVASSGVDAKYSFVATASEEWAEKLGDTIDVDMVSGGKKLTDADMASYEGLLVTPVVVRDYAPESVDNRLQRGYDTMQKTMYLGDLVSSKNTNEILREELQSLVTVEDVKDLIDIQTDLVDAEGNIIQEAAQAYFEAVYARGEKYVQIGDYTFYGIRMPITDDEHELVMSEMFDVSAWGTLAEFLDASEENSVILAIDVSTGVMNLVGEGGEDYEAQIVNPAGVTSEEDLIDQEYDITEYEERPIMEGSLVDFSFESGMILLASRDGETWEVMPENTYGRDARGNLILQHNPSYSVYGIATAVDTAEINGIMEQAKLRLEPEEDEDETAEEAVEETAEPEEPIPMSTIRISNYYAEKAEHELDVPTELYEKVNELMDADGVDHAGDTWDYAQVRGYIATAMYMLGQQYGQW